MIAKPAEFDDFLALFPAQPRKKAGNGWLVICPAHNDHEPSLWVRPSENSDFIATWDCKAGCCNRVDILNALHLNWNDMRRNHHSSDDYKGEIVALYDYTDPDGNLLYQAVRYEPKDFSQRRPGNNGHWIDNLKGVKRVVYRLPEVLEAVREGTTIYIVEGEKDADNLAKLNLIATTNSEGAGKWKPEYSELLKNAIVVIIPDRDKPGQRHADKVAASLQGKAKSIKIVELQDIGTHKVKDISDWLEAGGTLAELERLVNKAEEWQRESNSNNTGLICMADVEAEEVSWLWHPYIPKGKLTLLEGDPGVGKSWVGLAIATAISNGKGFIGE